MSCYCHITIEERECLMVSRERRESIRQMARKLGRAPSTISRELRRNPGPCSAVSAQKNYKKRRKACVRSKVLHDLELHKMVHFLLGYLWWSPEQISNRFREEGTTSISTSTIYRELDDGELQDTLRYYLRIKYHKHGKNKEPNKLCFQKSISLRPEAAALSSEPGHWEGDTIRGSCETDSLVTLVDRYSRVLLCEKVPNKESGTVRRAVVRLLTRSSLPIRSITFVQGTEFVENVQMEQELGVDGFYAHPRSPRERPTNENTNGLIRQFVPKRSKVSALTEEDVSRFIAALNFRPRKCLGWKTPYEIAFNEVLRLT